MIQYFRVHRLLVKTRGRAAEHQCSQEGCSRQAVEWAWDRTGETVKEEIFSFGEMRTLRFSLDPERYRPMCKPCHVSFDKIQDREKFPCGHRREGENRYDRPDGSSYCRTCHREAERERYRRSRSLADQDSGVR